MDRFPKTKKGGGRSRPPPFSSTLQRPRITLGHAATRRRGRKNRIGKRIHCPKEPRKQKRPDKQYRHLRLDHHQCPTNSGQHPVASVEHHVEQYKQSGQQDAVIPPQERRQSGIIPIVLAQKPARPNVARPECFARKPTTRMHRQPNTNKPRTQRMRDTEANHKTTCALYAKVDTRTPSLSPRRDAETPQTPGALFAHGRPDMDSRRNANSRPCCNAIAGQKSLIFCLFPNAQTMRVPRLQDRRRRQVFCFHGMNASSRVGLQRWEGRRSAPLPTHLVEALGMCPS